MTDKFEITLPETTPEFMAGAYFSCLRWAITFEPILKRFEDETGNRVPKSRSGIERMIDEACGFDQYEYFFRAFVPWFNENVWGDA